MNEKQIKVLVTPLDWGLGHATRCIPIINELLKRNCRVSIATSGDALLLLKTEFPQLEFFMLPSYKASYSRTVPFMINVFRQLPKFLWIIRKEHRLTKKIIKEQGIELIISDSRFGCWSKLAPTVFITHQTNILMPTVWKWIEPVINYFNHQQIKKFGQCWIPDFPNDRITGALTKTSNLNARFIGMLSRFKKPDKLLPVTYDYVILISGPEPQRTAFEKLIRENIQTLPGKKIMVKGRPKLGQEISWNGSFEEVGHLQSEKLRFIIESADMIISRSGYTTIMDLAALQKKAFFIPTPGQTEQEQLAIELKKRDIAYYQEQKDFDLSVALKEVKSYTGFKDVIAASNLLSNAVDDLLISLSNA